MFFKYFPLYSQYAANGGDGGRLNVANHVVLESFLDTDDNMGDHHVINSNQLSIRARNSNAPYQPQCLLHLLVILKYQEVLMYKL